MMLGGKKMKSLEQLTRTTVKRALTGIAAAVAVVTLAGCQTGEYTYTPILVSNANIMTTVNGVPTSRSENYVFSKAKSPIKLFGGDRKSAYNLTIETSDGRVVTCWDANRNGEMDAGDAITLGRQAYNVGAQHSQEVQAALDSAAATYARIAAEAGI